jgi:hypothetical protein
MSPSVGSVFHSSSAPSESLLPPTYFISSDPEGGGGGGGGAPLEAEVDEALLPELELALEELPLLDELEVLLDDPELLDQLLLEDHELLELQELDDQELELHELELPEEELPDEPLLEEPELEGELPLLLDHEELLVELPDDELHELLLPLDHEELLTELPDDELQEDQLLELALGDDDPLPLELEFHDDELEELPEEPLVELADPLLDDDAGIMVMSLLKPALEFLFPFQRFVSWEIACWGGDSSRITFNNVTNCSYGKQL